MWMQMKAYIRVLVHFCYKWVTVCTVHIFYAEWPENFIMESNGPDMIVCSLGEVLGHFISLHKITFLALIIFAVGKSKIFLNVNCFLLYILKNSFVWSFHQKRELWNCKHSVIDNKKNYVPWLLDTIYTWEGDGIMKT